MSYENLIIENEGTLRIITINRPKQLNALNRDTIAELNRAFTEAETDHSVRCIVITGSGDKAFVAGADIKEFAHFSMEEGAELSRNGQNTLFDLVENLRTPVIAAVNGFALGGGLELAMSTHIRVASDNARMGLPEVSLGVIPGYGGTQRLPQLVGKGIANEIIFTAGMIDANRAHEIGLVNHTVPAEELMDKCRDIAKKISRNSPIAISLAIECVNAVHEDGTNGYEVEINAFGRAFGTADFKEGTGAFMEKRKPAFEGH
ncbi:enoyl-CoA hydratase/isomerase family protein [bacterium SCSIO 12741]|nr:enoyl-CoA hydratase/isomerase family protein [bacterium SCSIO 12741]